MKKINIIKLLLIGSFTCLCSCEPVNSTSNTHHYSGGKYHKKVGSSQQVTVTKPYTIANGDLGSGRVISPQPRSFRKPISGGDLGSGRVFNPGKPISSGDLGSGRIKMNKPNFKPSTLKK